MSIIYQIRIKENTNKTVISNCKNKKKKYSKNTISCLINNTIDASKKGNKRKIKK